jgi:proton-translocating NADH-quinone oxidoreductase chain L|tara:strand:- start:4570 stop:6582 length:2013 start_codon:yes stop_codon:yes gene_type:complete
MLILIVLLPLLGFFSGSLFGRFIGWGSCYITTGSVFLSLIFSLILFFDVTSSGVVYKLTMGNWIAVDSLNIDWSFCFDSLTSVMLIVVTFISTLVHLYSTEYMEYDPHLPRFMSYLSLFTFFMLILITANNFLQMFVGWEGVGLSSYLLINFWFTRIQANKAAIKAMLVNRIGDFSLLLAIFAIYFVFNSLDYDTVFSLAPLMLDYKILIGGMKIPALDMICIFLFLGAMGKSAQLGLHTWLPDAMEGPTPVSALIHAATMVTAGVFLLARCSHLFEYSPLALNLIIFIGSATAFFASTTGLFQNDMKRVIAYSTCSQLGYMVFACGLSSYEVGIFHLSNHAFFKALLFLGAGSVIHAISDEQDMRKMGGLRKLLPFTYAIMLVGSLALMGFPFLTGFYSKDTILEVAYAKYTIWGHFSYYLGTFAAFFTAFYSIRLLFLVFLSEPNGSKSVILNAHEGSWRMTFPLFLLSIFSITIGFLTRDLFIGFGTDFWGAAIFVLPQNYVLSDIEFIDLFHKLLPLIVTLSGAFYAYFLYSINLEHFYEVKKTKTFKVFYNFLNRKWYFDRVYNQLIGQQSLNISYNFSYKSLDRGIIEKLGPSGIISSIRYTINHLNNLQSGQIYHYLFLFLIFSVIFLFITICFNNMFLSLNIVVFLFLLNSLIFSDIDSKSI